MSNFLKKPLVLKILSVILAVIIWAYAINSENPERDKDIRSVKVTITTEGSVPYNNGLAITEGLSQTVDVRIRGRNSALVEYDASRITATVDINSITEEGTYTLPVNVVVPGDNVWLVNYTPTRLTYTFSKMTTASVPVNVIITGAPNAEYVITETSADPASVGVTGPVSEVNYVSHADLYVDATNAAGDFSYEGELVLINKGGERVRSKNVGIAASTATAHIKMNKKKTVPLTFDITGEADEGLVFDISPESIVITGSDEVLSAITEINVGSVNAENLTDGGEVYLNIPVPEGVTLVDETTSARITAQTASDNANVNGDLSETASKLIENVAIDISALEEAGFSEEDITLSSSTVNVIVVGNIDELAAITADNISAVADFSGLSPEAGVYEIPVNVTVNTDDEDNTARVTGTYTISAEVK
ncbi:MAG: hypothetical protein IKD89_05250 [Clostridia bacterium]|nr:hypothetical protein [Clostridia bacterium]